jgi:hypothetical protein
MYRIAWLGVCVAAAGAARGATVTVEVPGVACPWLAGFPDGTTGYGADVAPDESPVLVPVTVPPGASFTITDATGAVSKSAGRPFYGPDGEAGDATGSDQGPFGGIGYLLAPKVSLIGVFLDDAVPLDSPPAGLSFALPADRDFLVLAPAMGQPFFIGDGRTSSDTAQEFWAPAGATRLYLGVMDKAGWDNNPGSFSVTLAMVPEAATAMPVVLAGLLLRRRRWGSPSGGAGT